MLAETIAYGKLPSGWTCNAAPSERVALDDENVISAVPVVVQLIRNAGVRLTEILNEALK